MKKNCTLIIDTRSAVETTVSLMYEGKETKKTIPTNHAHSQAVLPLIEQILTEQHVSLKNITHIEVSIDSGSYTGRRVGAAIAQVLGSLLHVPVNLRDASQPIDIPYGKDKWNKP